jgi:membrane fusion protein, copper/silver efflux system
VATAAFKSVARKLNQPIERFDVLLGVCVRLGEFLSMRYRNRLPPQDDDSRAFDEGGLRAPPGLQGWRKAWWWFDFIILVKLARLRFIGILALIGVIITQWDTLASYYDKWTRPATATLAESSDVEYFCPMHPAVVRENAREKCPICCMPLSKRKKGQAHAEALPAGIVNRVQLSPYRVVLAGVSTWPVDYWPLAKEITAVGYVEFNERGQRTVSARSSGRIEKLLVNETGKMVQEGDDLALLYSPDLLVTEQNLLSAMRSNNREMLASARMRLGLLGIDEAQIDEILQADKPSTYVRIKSPISGHVITKYVKEGQYVDEGKPLYDLADLSSVWIQAQIYEDDLSFLPVGYEHGSAPSATSGLEVTARTRAFPNEPFRGKLAFIYPHVDQDTRTVTVRFEVDNPGHRLRPGSTASITLKVQPKEMRGLSTVARDTHGAEMLAEGRILAVPESAVIDTGSQKIVYRETEPNVFEGVEVELGPRMSDPQGATFYPVLTGLAQGARVVTSGSFLVDAETRLNPAAGSIYFGGSGGSSSAASSGTTVRASTPEDPDAKIKAALAKLSPEDHALAESQRSCPVLTDNLLGSMGMPVKLLIDGQTVFLCCSACKSRALSDKAATLARVTSLRNSAPARDAAATTLAGDANDASAGPKGQRQSGTENGGSGEEQDIAAALASLSTEDRLAVETQKFCPVLRDSRLGSMGAPIKLMVDGQPVFVCCDGCTKRALAQPTKTLAIVNELKAQGSSE